MATLIRGAKFGNRKYPLDQWSDGKARVAKKGEDFEDAKKFRASVYQTAHRLNKKAGKKKFRAEVSLTSDSPNVVRFRIAKTKPVAVKARRRA